MRIRRPISRGFKMSSRNPLEDIVLYLEFPNGKNIQFKPTNIKENTPGQTELPVKIDNPIPKIKSSSPYGAYLYKVANGYRVQKGINGIQVGVTYPPTEFKKAQKVRDYFLKVNWKGFEQFCKMKRRDPKMKYIIKNKSGTYTVARKFDGKRFVMGTFNDLETAQQVRDAWGKMGFKKSMG